MKNTLFLLVVLAVACTDSTGQKSKTQNSSAKKSAPKVAAPMRFAGTISNGMKGDSIFFDISKDGKQLQNLTFKGYWRCSGRLEQMTAGPEGNFNIVGGKVNDHISEPPGGGSTAWRFDLEANLQGNKANGTFRMNINNLGCDTYKLQWTAVAVP